MHGTRRPDVAILGGGLAGLTLALQLRREVPDASVLVVDRKTRPLPEAAFKVGESTTEVGCHYLADTLALRAMLDDRHVLKHGLRFFFPATDGFADRPELGLVDDPVYPTYQLDRGRLETDLRERVAAASVELLEGWTVDQVGVGTSSEPHRIALSGPDGTRRDFEADWLVDASGRRRLLQRDLGLEAGVDRPCSAAWFRVRGRVDVEDLVARDNVEWHARVPAGRRHRSTIHLMGDGYWVWIIPLASDATSIGIAARRDIHPFDRYNTLVRAREWLAGQEPELAILLAGHEVMDFRTMDRYSFAGRRVLSRDRWACVGDAAFFADPLYAPGVDLIGFSNTVITDLIRRDRAGALHGRDVDHYDRWLRTLNSLLGDNIQAGYPYFGHAVPTATKILWETAMAWGYVAPQMFNRTFLDRERARAIHRVTGRLFFLQDRMQRLFANWGARPPGRLSFRFISYLELPFLRDLAVRNLEAGKTTADLVADHEENVRILEELAEAIFRVAVEDVLPEHYPALEALPRINVWGIGLDPERWDRDALFEPSPGEPGRWDVHASIRSRLEL